MSLLSLNTDQQVFTVGTALATLTASFERVGAESPAVSAQWLMANLCGVPRLTLPDLADQVLGPSQLEQFETMAGRVARAEPLQYIIGHAAFMEWELVCDQRALIPRPETETLLATIFAESGMTERSQPAVIDVGTGSGCIALAMAAEWPTAQVMAIDYHQAALALARVNAERLNLVDRIVWRHGDLLEGIPEQSADLVVANLPYISTSDWLRLSPEVRLHEPRTALDAGPNGTELLMRLIDEALPVLRSGGWLYLEIGSDQGGMIKQAMVDKGFVEVEIRSDLAGRERIVKGGRK